MKSRLRRATTVLLLACLASVMSAKGARAADSTAEALFRAGKQASAAGDFATACEKFEASQRLEPAPGTLLNLGDCEEHLGHFAQASRYFQSAIALYRPGDSRIAYAKQRVATAESHMAHVVLLVPPAVAAQTKVSWDGAELEPGALGRPRPADPGEHVVLVRAPGRSEARITVKLSQGETKELTLQPGEPLKSEPPPIASAPAEPSASGTLSEPPRRPLEPPSAPRRGHTGSDAGQTLGYVGLGVGALGVGVGLVAGLLTMNAKSDADEHCSAKGCDADGLSAQDRGKTWSTISTVGFIAGGVGLAAGASLLLFRPARTSASAVSARPTAGGAELQWVGHF